MAKNKLIKIYKIFCWVILVIAFGMILGFAIMFTMLVRFKNCYDLDFAPKYCERYKDF